MGLAGADANGETIILHHFGQNPNGPVVEIPSSRHSVWNSNQHPFGNISGAGLTAEQRAAFNPWRNNYWRARATQELIRRGLTP